MRAEVGDLRGREGSAEEGVEHTSADAVSSRYGVVSLWLCSF